MTGAAAFRVGCTPANLPVEIVAYLRGQKPAVFCADFFSANFLPKPAAKRVFAAIAEMGATFFALFYERSPTSR